MSEYTLKFDAKFSDNEAELITKIASILTGAKAELLTAELERLQAELQQARERERWKPIDVMPDTDGEIVADLYRGERRNV